MAKYRTAWACLALVACMEPVDPEFALPAAPAPAGEIGALSVMSYNVKGLPWPAGLGRDEPLGAIGARLAAMRRDGMHPQIVVLQEAFVETAKEIGFAGGYRHIAFGPGPGAAPVLAKNPIGPGYARGASWLKGEAIAPVLDSGLAVFSDYPIERVERLAFPQGACAGFDCLAAKGVLIAWIRIPGHADPVAVATTHLNSRHSSGVPLPRADAAFAWQLARVREFASARIGRGKTAILAGDFNLGADANRWAAARRIGPPLLNSHEAVADALTLGAIPPRHHAEAETVRRKGTDQVFYRSGKALSLEVMTLDIPFPQDGNGHPLSDHPGLMVRYRLVGADQTGNPT